MKQYVIALDQGTTSSRAILFDQEQNIVGLAQKEFTQHYPHPGWVEHDPMEIYSSQYGVLMEVLAQSGIDAKEIAGIGITNQRETTIVWERDTGRPVCNATPPPSARSCWRIKSLPPTSRRTPAFWWTPIFPPPS